MTVQKRRGGKRPMLPEEKMMRYEEARKTGQRIRKARRDAGLSQQALADHLNVWRTTLIAMEQGRRRVQVDELTKIAEVCGISLEELTGGEVETPKDFPLPVQARHRAIVRDVLKGNYPRAIRSLTRLIELEDGEDD